MAHPLFVLLFVLPIFAVAYAGYLVIATLLWLGAWYFGRPVLWQLGRSLAVGTGWAFIVGLTASATLVLVSIHLQSIFWMFFYGYLLSVPVQLLAPSAYSVGTYGLSRYRDTPDTERPPKEEPNA